MISSFKEICRQWLKGAQSGTAMTEFVAMIPIFLTIFVAILEMGALARQIPVSTAGAVKETFSTDKLYKVQDQGMGGIGSALTDIGVHNTSGAAAADAFDQVIENPPKGDQVTSLAIKGLEANAYGLGLSTLGGTGGLGGMAANGMWGESVGRLAPIGLAGDVAYIMGAEEAATANPGQLMGESSLAKSLLYDGYRPRAATDLGCEGAGVLANVLQVANQGLNAAGIRAPLAAGVTYGTVTGEKTNSGSIGGMSYSFNDYYTATVPPRGFPRSNGMATFLTRLAMENCSTHPAYQGLLGVGTDGLGGAGQAIDVPKPGEAGFTTPLDYRSE